MPWALDSALIGQQPVAPFILPDTTARHASGLIVAGVDPYWGGGEFFYAKAGGTIPQYGLSIALPVVASGAYSYVMTACPNTANLGQSVAVAMTAMTSGQFGWFMMTGVTPINGTASVAADTAFGITAAGQVGAIANGKQISSARITVAATATVAKTNSTNNSGSKTLNVSDSAGWFAGIYLSGTGVAAGATVTDISPDGRTVLMSAVSTAAINGTVTGTYNNATVYYNVAYINRPFAQGQVT